MHKVGPLTGAKFPRPRWGDRASGGAQARLRYTLLRPHEKWLVVIVPESSLLMASWGLGHLSQSRATSVNSAVVSISAVPGLPAGALVQVWVWTKLKEQGCFASKAIIGLEQVANRCCHLKVKRSRIHYPTVFYFGVFIVLSYRHRNNDAGRGFLWTPLTCLRQRLQKELSCHTFPPGVFD